MAGVACSSPLETGIDRLEHYFETRTEKPDPSWASLFGYLNRRFGLVVQSSSTAPLHRQGESPLYRRLDDPTSTVPVEAITSLASATDRMTALALHCQRLGLPADWPDVLGAATRAGGYALTHAALAGEWSIENGCISWARLAEVRQAQIDALVALATDWKGLVTQYTTPVDLGIEAIVMLDYLGAGSRVEPEWIDGILAMQRSDGGLPNHPGAEMSDPHTSALALWALLGRLRPGAPRVPWIVQANDAQVD